MRLRKTILLVVCIIGCIALVAYIAYTTLNSKPLPLDNPIAPRIETDTINSANIEQKILELQQRKVIRTLPLETTTPELE